MSDGTTAPAGAKLCNKCGEVKPLDEFYRHKKCKGGYRPVCKVCHNAQVKARRLERMQDPVLAERERAARRESAKRWRDDNPDKISEINRKQRAQKGERIREYDRSRYAADPDGRKTHIYAWRERNQDVVRGYATVRQARLRESVSGVVNYEVISSLYSDCYLCSLPLAGKIHIDHVVPLSRGGAHCMDNLRPTHPRCNLRKNSRLLSELDWYTGPTDLGVTQ